MGKAILARLNVGRSERVARGGERQSRQRATVGFIGLGTMGARMAGNLQKAGYKLDRQRSAQGRRRVAHRRRRGVGRHAARASPSSPT